MMDTDTQQAPERQGGGHALWLAMQSAYGEYQSASAALNLSSLQEPVESSSPEEVARVFEALRCQRLAFEHYVESRMQFSEFLCDRREPDSTPAAPDTGAPTHTPPLPFEVSRPVAYLLAIVFLSTTSFLLARDWRHVRDLEIAHNQMRAIVTQNQSIIQALQKQLNPEPQLAAQKSPNSPVTAAAVPPAQPKATEEQRRVVSPQLPAHRKQMPKKRDTPVKTQATVQNSNPPAVSKPVGRNYYDFTLTSSRDFQRVGPVRLSLRAVNRDRTAFDLSVISDRVQFERKNLKLREPLSIRLGDRPAPLELVVTRIDRDRVQGYLSEPKPNQREHVSSDFRRRMADSP